MDREDAFLCLERHATSKLRNEADLFHLQTLGFRGEALPSIAAISRLRLRTRIADELEGWEIQVEGGTVRHAEAVGMPVGTLIEVRNLFSIPRPGANFYAGMKRKRAISAIRSPSWPWLVPMFSFSW